MSKFQIDLTNYPSLYKLFDEDKKAFGAIMKQAVDHIDESLENGRMDTAKEVYKMEYLDMIETLSDAFFDYNGLADEHKQVAEREGIKGLGEDLHPLAIFTNHVPVYNAAGKRIDPSEWLPLDDFSLKDWLYALFYGARFVSWKELSEYLTLGRFDLIETLQARNFEQLQKIQPALAYQEKQGIIKGKLIPGTGYLECGSEYHELCPACETGVINHKHSKFSSCPKCSAGFIK